MNDKKIRCKFFIGLCLSMMCLPSHAFDLRKDQPIDFQAEFAEFNRKTGIGFYQGNVTLSQGNNYITADHAASKHDKQHQLIKAIAEGIDNQPATFFIQPESHQPAVIGKAKMIQYLLDKNKIILLGNAEITQGEHAYRAEKIEYDMINQKISTPADTDQRVEMIIQPKQHHEHIRSKALSEVF